MNLLKVFKSFRYFDAASNVYSKVNISEAEAEEQVEDSYLGCPGNKYTPVDTSDEDEEVVATAFNPTSTFPLSRESSYSSIESSSSSDIGSSSNTRKSRTLDRAKLAASINFDNTYFTNFSDAAKYFQCIDKYHFQDLEDRTVHFEFSPEHENICENINPDGSCGEYERKPSKDLTSLEYVEAHINFSKALTEAGKELVDRFSWVMHRPTVAFGDWIKHPELKNVMKHILESNLFSAVKFKNYQGLQNLATCGAKLEARRIIWEITVEEVICDQVGLANMQHYIEKLCFEAKNYVNVEVIVVGVRDMAWEDLMKCATLQNASELQDVDFVDKFWINDRTVKGSTKPFEYHPSGFEALMAKFRVPETEEEKKAREAEEYKDEMKWRKYMAGLEETNRRFREIKVDASKKNV